MESYQYELFSQNLVVVPLPCLHDSSKQSAHPLFHQRVGILDHVLDQKRVLLEDEKIEYKITREKFLNYRLLRAYVQIDKKTVPSYVLPYSLLKRKFVKTKVESKICNYYTTRHENIYILTLDEFNKLSNKNYKNIQDIINRPLSFDEELKVRNKIIQNFYSLSPVIIVENIEANTKITIYLDAKIYQDTREHLVQLG